MSMVVAFTITPWLAYRALRGRAASSGGEEPGDARSRRRSSTASTRALLAPFLDDRRRAWGLLGGVVLLFVAAAGARRCCARCRSRCCPSTTRTSSRSWSTCPRAPRSSAPTRSPELAEVLRRAPEVRDFELYSGLASPMDFNGMVRHYFLRQGPNVADIRVNLAASGREMQSHAIVLRLRDELEAVARGAGARITLVEMPPGPPVLATITAEVYGEPQLPYETLAERGARGGARLAREPASSDVDTSVEDDPERWLFVTDKEKAALSGVATQDVDAPSQLALGGLDATRLHLPGEVNPLPIRCVCRARRAPASRRCTHWRSRASPAS